MRSKTGFNESLIQSSASLCKAGSPRSRKLFSLTFHRMTGISSDMLDSINADGRKTPELADGMHINSSPASSPYSAKSSARHCASVLSSYAQVADSFARLRCAPPGAQSGLLSCAFDDGEKTLAERVVDRDAM